MKLKLMTDSNKSRHRTAFTVSIEAKDGITTGISAKDRAHTILYGKGLKDPIKETLRWLEYCNIKEQDPNAQILKEFEIVLKVKVNVDSSVQKM